MPDYSAGARLARTGTGSLYYFALGHATRRLRVSSVDVSLVAGMPAVGYVPINCYVFCAVSGGTSETTGPVDPDDVASTANFYSTPTPTTVPALLFSTEMTYAGAGRRFVMPKRYPLILNAATYIVVRGGLGVSSNTVELEATFDWSE